eukprot:CAMPEP_0194092014 /NCGR_PEP_ID=MMETSP0149-20130528/45348_1 /TAXON_ID=122233 /ORGANISM="Chaetoceros debilis, Strain MM31A-1" /LENGTH=603 /DNA_ID=CAMNT_0038776819 /DNA_START=163 /DNA_END=1971 /DNA_ORIENTATION=+
MVIAFAAVAIRSKPTNGERKPLLLTDLMGANRSDFIQESTSSSSRLNLSSEQNLLAHNHQDSSMRNRTSRNEDGTKGKRYHDKEVFDDDLNEEEMAQNRSIYKPAASKVKEISSESITETRKVDNHNHNHNNGDIPPRQQQDLPVFLLHVGPPKSGTTTIQHEIHTPWIKDLLRKDNYTVVEHGVIHVTNLLKKRRTIHGKRADWNETDNKGNESERVTFDFSKVFIQTMKKNRNTPGLNVFGSSEYLRQPSRGQCQEWKDKIMTSSDSHPHPGKTTTKAKNEEKKWNLQVLIEYRRLHSYLPSTWNQMHKFFRIDYRPIQIGHRNWPGIKNDYRIPSFEDWFVEEHYNKANLHPARKAYNAWKQCSNGITILNIHDRNIHVDGGAGGGAGDDDDDDGSDSGVIEGDLTTNFVCKALKGANNTCRELISRLRVDDQYSIESSSSIATGSSAPKISTNTRRRRLSRDNSSLNLDYDILAVYAYEHMILGMHKRGAEEYGQILEEEGSFYERGPSEQHQHHKRHLVTRRIQKHVESNDIELPITCPNTTILDYIYTWSLESEQWALSLTTGNHAQGQQFYEATVANDFKPRPLSLEQVANFNSDW